MLVIQRQVLTARCSRHFSQVTSQHHLKTHLQLVCSSTILRVCPRLQHNRSHRSDPELVTLHSLPWVPRAPDFALGEQKSGDSSANTSWYLFAGLVCGLSGMKLFPSLRNVTFLALSYRSRSRPATSRNGGIFSQQVFTVQEPDSPWHLHSSRMASRMAWKVSGFKQTNKFWFYKLIYRFCYFQELNNKLYF